MYWKTLKDQIQEIVADFLQFMQTEADKLILLSQTLRWYIPKESL